MEMCQSVSNSNTIIVR